MRKVISIAALGLAALAAGCTTAGWYSYQPAEQQTARIDGQAAARYAIPPESPRGDVRIASFGITEVSPDGDADIPVVHLRAIVANDAGAGPWSVDTRDIRVELRGGPALGEPYVNADSSTLPAIEVRPGQQRSIDLFYPLPEGMEDPEDVPAFDVTWKVRTDAREVIERTPFERLEIEREPPRTTWVVGYGPVWWYEPWYRPAVIVRPGIVVRSHVHHHPHRAHRTIIRRPPRWR
jgi:hypothetical protein